MAAAAATGDLGRDQGSPTLSEDERTELTRLRAEVAELRSRPAGGARRHRVSWRTPVATVLIVIGCILLGAIRLRGGLAVPASAGAAAVHAA